MCRGCYDEYGAPNKRSNATTTAIILIHQVYEHDPVAGNVHIVLDDWNIEDDLIDEMLNKDELTSTERQCMKVMREMSLDERATALAIYDRFIPLTP